MTSTSFLGMCCLLGSRDDDSYGQLAANPGGSHQASCNETSHDFHTADKAYCISAEEFAH